MFKKTGFFLLLCFAILAVFSSVPAFSVALPFGPQKTARLNYSEGEVLVKFKPGISPAEAGKRVSSPAVSAVREFRILSKKRPAAYLLLRSGSLTTSELIAQLRKNPAVLGAWPNYRRQVSLLPDDQYFTSLWGLNNTGQSVDGVSGTPDADIDAPEAWNTGTGSEAVIVAVIDTGVNYNHVDLTDNMWHNPGEIPDNVLDDDGNGFVDDYYGYDFAADNSGNNDSDPMPTGTHTPGHGSHVSGTIAGRGNNGLGVAGVCWQAKIMALKAQRPDGYLYDADCLEAIEYAIMMKELGHNIVAFNASYGGTGGSDSDPVADAIESAGDAGIVFCASAGNDDSDNDAINQFPATYSAPSIISVAASDQDDELASFSCFGSHTVDLAAPGVSVYSTYWPTTTGYTYLDGTSMACPHVAGAVALMASQYPDETAYRRINRLLSGVDKPGGFSGKTVTGGRLNLNNSISPGLVFNPFISGVSPDTGLSEDMQLIITGLEFGTTAGTVIFSYASGQEEVNSQTWTNTEITVKVPALPSAGKYLAVKRPDGRESNFHTVSAWQPKDSLILGNWAGAAAIYQAKIYVFGGADSLNWTATTSAGAYDPAADAWSGILSLPVARAGLSAAELNGKIYCLGGWSGKYDSAIDTVDVIAYDPATDTYTDKNSLPQARSFAAAVNLNDAVYLIGGYNNGSYTKTLYRYNTGGDSWTGLASMSVNRAGHGAVALNNRIYVFGGLSSAGHPLSSGEAYNPDTNSWSAIADMPIALFGLAAVTDGRYIYAAGGSSSTASMFEGMSRVFLKYNPATNTWSYTPGGIRELITPKLCASAAYIDGLGIFIPIGSNSELWEKMEFLNIPPTATPNGDINADEEVNITDVILCLRQAIGLDTVDLSLSDINGDEEVNITDVILVLRKAIGLDTKEKT